MTDLVDADKIETIVGHKRMDYMHLGRAVSDEGQFYILHSKRCVRDTEDLRACLFSVALDNGVEIETEDAVQTLRVDWPKGPRLRAINTVEISAT